MKLEVTKEDHEFAGQDDRRAKRLQKDKRSTIPGDKNQMSWRTKELQDWRTRRPEVEDSGIEKQITRKYAIKKKDVRVLHCG